MTRIAHIRDFSDVAALGGSSNSKLVMSLGQRFESARRLSRFGVDKRNTRSEGVLGDAPGTHLHHPYITEIWVKGVHKLLPRNAFRNA
jgi:hypothetical protein